jgi:hypothetical protein
MSNTERLANSGLNIEISQKKTHRWPRYPGK